MSTDAYICKFSGLLFQLEDQDRKRIEQVKTDERTRAMEELEKWKEQQQQLAEEVLKYESVTNICSCSLNFMYYISFIVINI